MPLTIQDKQKRTLVF